MDRYNLEQYLSKKYPEINGLMTPPYQSANLMVDNINYCPMSFAFVVDDITLAAYLIALGVKITDNNMREIRSKDMFLTVREHISQEQIDNLFQVVCNHEKTDMIDAVAQFAREFQNKDFNFPASMCDIKDAEWAISIMKKYESKWDVRYNCNEALASARYPQTVEYFISRGADINSRDEEGLTPLEQSLETYSYWRTMDHSCDEPVDYEKASPELMESDGHILKYLNDPEMYRSDCHTCIVMTKRMIQIIDAYMTRGSPKPEHDLEGLATNYLRQ